MWDGPARDLPLVSGHMNRDKILRIPRTLELICDCWDQAERALQQEIAHDCPNMNEEEVV